MIQGKINTTIKVKWFWLIILFLFSCISQKDDVSNNENEPHKFVRNHISEFKPKVFFERLASKPQKFQIRLKSDTTIVGENGVRITIPTSSFVDKDGNIVTQDITLEIIEASSIEDYIRNDLQTISNGKLLESAGMIYIDAKVNNESIFLEENSILQIEMPTTIYANNYTIFNGEHDEIGNINWVEADELYDFLIPLPMSEFHYKFYKKYSFPTKYSSIRWMDSTILNDPKYENTFIATLDFESRFDAMDMDYDWWEEYEDGFDHDRAYGKVYNINCPLLDIYLQNLDKPLWYSDSIAYQVYREKDVKDSIDLFTNHGWDENSLFINGSNDFKLFYNIKQTNVRKYDPKGVDLSEPNALKKLIEAGYSRKEAKEQLYIHGERERIIIQRANRRRESELTDMVDETIATGFKKAFNVTSLGWINVDQFYDDTRSKEVQLFTNITSDSLEYSDVTLILPSRNIAINGIQLDKHKFTFTQNMKEYSKLPVGEEAIIVAISIKNEVPYLAIEKFVIKEKQSINLEVIETTWVGIDDKLSGMN